MSEDKVESRTHTHHRCMRCTEEFECKYPAQCSANYDVLGIHGQEHCPLQPDWNWIRAYGKRMATRPSVPQQGQHVQNELHKMVCQIFPDTPNTSAEDHLVVLGHELKKLLAASREEATPQEQVDTLVNEICEAYENSGGMGVAAILKRDGIDPYRQAAPAAGSAERDLMWFATQTDKIIEHRITTIGESPDVLFALKAVQHDIATMAALAGTDTDVAKEKL